MWAQGIIQKKRAAMRPFLRRYKLTLELDGTTKIPERSVQPERRGNRLDRTQELEGSILLFVGVSVEDIVATDSHCEGFVDVPAGFQINQDFAAIF